MSVGQLIALDIGQVTTGLARASARARLVEPLAAVPTSQILTKLQELAAQEEIAGVVMGLPRGLQGQDTDQTRWVRQWAKDFQKRVSWPLFWQDEALTSQLSQLESPKKASASEHSLAASIILQDFLDAPESQRVPYTGG